jgi:hypothetical protein
MLALLKQAQVGSDAGHEFSSAAVKLMRHPRLTVVPSGAVRPAHVGEKNPDANEARRAKLTTNETDRAMAESIVKYRLASQISAFDDRSTAFSVTSAEWRYILWGMITAPMIATACRVA